MTKLICPKCGNDAFKISLTEQLLPIQKHKWEEPKHVAVFQLLHITCSKCGWNKHFMKPPQ